MLPDGLEFLKPGWWMLHVLAVGMVFVWGYREGRDAEREERREAERTAVKPPAPPADPAPKS